MPKDRKARTLFRPFEPAVFGALAHQLRDHGDGYAALGMTSGQAADWANTGFLPGEAEPWLAAGFGAKEASHWANRFVSPTEARRRTDAKQKLQRSHDEQSSQERGPASPRRR